MDNRRVFLAALLSLAVLIAWQFLFPAGPKVPTPPLESRDAGGAVSAPLAASPAPPEPSRGVLEPRGADPGVAAAPRAEVAPVAAAFEETAVLETDLFRAEFTNRGAQLRSFVVKDHKDQGGAPLDLVRRRAGDWPLPWSILELDGSPSVFQGRLFRVERGEGSLAFAYAGPEGEVRKTFHVVEGGALEVEVVVPGRRDWSLAVAQGLRNPSAEEMKSQFSRRSAIWLVGEDLETVAPDGLDQPTKTSGVGLRWVGVEDTYFLAAVAPTTAVLEVVARPLLEEPVQGESTARFLALPPEDRLTEAQKDFNREVEVFVTPGAERFLGVAYFGAKSLPRLSAQPWGFDRSIHWGTFGLLARPLLLALRWIHEHVVSNWGWAIVLMTVLINLLLLPLNHKSYVSMKKMQELNPRMQAVREKWRGRLKDNKGRPNVEAQRKMQEEINALFKAEGVNPAGGCLPILLQMPVLFAFYSLLSTAVELRGAPWWGWIHDLSAADPYYALPAVMGLTQFVQQKMTPSVADPMQRRLFQLMPIFFTVLFLGFPAGLVLYWLVNNLLGIARQMVYNSIQRRRATAVAR